VGGRLRHTQVLHIINFIKLRIGPAHLHQSSAEDHSLLDRSGANGDRRDAFAELTMIRAFQNFLPKLRLINKEAPVKPSVRAGSAAHIPGGVSQTHNFA